MSPSRSAGTRDQILERAMDLASIEGLEGLTIGRLAESLGMSKSGVMGHFESKEDLQLATVDAARQRFEARVMAGVSEEPGLARLAALVESWTAYVEGDCFPGGCFFWAASAEFDGRPGKVRDRLAELTRSWLDLLQAEARLAQRLGEIREDADPGQLAFELHAFVQEANWAWQLLRREDAFGRARRAARERLAAVSTDRAPAL